ncbi:hypothetical protein HRbin41_01139 [bacterium HR41]|nr:hypothetical protein HRbin41_01139 [bacterium HR41]
MPLAASTVASQATIVALAPILAAVARDFGTGVGTVGLARAVLAFAAAAGSVPVAAYGNRLGPARLIVLGGVIGLCACAAIAAAPSLTVFLAAHIVAGGAVACLLSAGFAGASAFFHGREVGWALGFVVGAQSLAWIVGNPIIGVLTDTVSWRAAYLVPATAALVAVVGGLRAPRTCGSGDSGLAALVSIWCDVGARRWTVAELVAFGAWTAELTYAGAFYIETYGVREASVGFLLACGSAVYLAVAATSGRHLVGRRARLWAIAGALGMAAAFVPLLNVTPAVAFTLAAFCLTAFFAALRSTASSALALAQLPAQEATMMAARTASAQLGYVFGAAAGGAVIGAAGFGTLGWLLAAGMCASALLMARVPTPTSGRPGATARAPSPPRAGS